MILEEFDEEKYLETVKAHEREEGIQIGEQRGIQIGKEEGIQIGKEEGIQIGEERGKELGKQLEKISTAKKLLESHVERNIILTATGLTEEELNKIEQGNL